MASTTRCLPSSLAPKAISVRSTFSGSQSLLASKTIVPVTSFSLPCQFFVFSISPSLLGSSQRKERLIIVQREDEALAEGQVGESPPHSRFATKIINIRAGATKRSRMSNGRRYQPESVRQLVMASCMKSFFRYQPTRIEVRIAQTGIM